MVQFKRKISVSDKAVTPASELTLRESIYPVALVTILFFLWGFGYGLLDSLNKHVQDVLGVTRAQSGGLQAAYFGAYFIGPLTFSGYIVRRWGYKVTFITGLCILAVGSFMFWPASVKLSFGGLVAAQFIVGCGLSSLEVSANPFISVCGPPRYSEIRLNTAQAFQAIGTVVAPVLASHVFFTKVSGAQALSSVQWTYLALACFVLLLAVVFYFSKIPEITDADMAKQATESGYNYDSKPIYKQKILLWGTMAQFMYVGSQVAIAGYFINYIVEERSGTSNATAANLLALAQACFAIGRFLGAGLMKFFKARILFLIYLTGAIIFQVVAVATGGNPGLASLCLVLFFESIIFPTIFTLSLRGLGRHTKRGGSFLVSAVSGGALFPPLTGFAGDAAGMKIAMLVPLGGFVLAYTFPLYINLFQRDLMDSFSRSAIGVGPKRGSVSDAAVVEKGYIGDEVLLQAPMSAKANDDKPSGHHVD